MPCNKNTDKKSGPAAAAMRSLSPATIQPTIPTTTSALTSGPSESIHACAFRGSFIFSSNVLTAIPNTSGSSTTMSIVWKRAQAFTGIHAPASQRVSHGVANTAVIVDVIVSSTLSGTLARARWQMTFDTVPPGQQATRIKPSARPVSRLKAFAKPHPASGMIANCANTPSAIRFGSRSTAEKSENRRVSPMPSITTPSATSIHGLKPNQAVGWNHAHAQPNRSHSGKPAVIFPEILVKLIAHITPAQGSRGKLFYSHFIVHNAPSNHRRKLCAS